VASTPSRFEQPGLWGGLHLFPDIRQKIAVFESLIPADVETILDVGCGDGAITNSLAQRWSVTGVDSSKAALAHVTGPAVWAQAEALPFPDRSVDLVLSSEMLEHLGDASYHAALSEVLRVARRYVLISVPYREQLRMRFSRCATCGGRAHVWGHQRTFTVESLLRDMVCFNALDVRIFGYLEAPRLPGALLWTLQEVFRRGYYTVGGQHFLCPHCGSTEFSSQGVPRPAVALAQLLLLQRRKPALPFWMSVLAERR
jgi:SAM-dependent methyltransferase